MRNYTHNKLTEIFGDDYATVLNTKSGINPQLKAAIDNAFKISSTKNEFKANIKLIAKLTPRGIKECEYCRSLLKTL